MTTLTQAPPAAPAALVPGAARWHAGHLFEHLLPASATGGDVAVLRVTARPGFDPPRHVHAAEDETFHVLDGSVTFEVGGRLQVAGPGEIVVAPRGVPHAFRIGADGARMLVVITPGSGERLFEEFSVPAEELELPPLGEHLPDLEALGRRMAELGITVVGAPLEDPAVS